jgi:hypothetical protein
MQLVSLASAVCWGYPAVLYITYIASRLLIALSRKKHDVATDVWYEKQRRVAFAAIFWLQSALCVNLVSAILN